MISRIDHTAYRVSATVASLRFYCDGLDFAPVLGLDRDCAPQMTYLRMRGETFSDSLGKVD